VFEGGKKSKLLKYTEYPETSDLLALKKEILRVTPFTDPGIPDINQCLQRLSRNANTEFYEYSYETIWRLDFELSLKWWEFQITKISEIKT
jgi:hypothetical protein